MSQQEVYGNADALATRPRSGAHADQPGKYRLMAVPDRRTINPGDEIRVDFQITGYGHIDAAKLTYFSPRGFAKKAVAHSSYRFVPRSETLAEIEYAAYEDEIDDPCSAVVILQGLGAKNSDISHFVIDWPAKGRVRPVTTERRGDGRAPMIINFETEHCSPGDYTARFSLVYFNGREWAISEDDVVFHVNNFAERHPIFITLLAVATLAVAVLALA